MQTAAKQKKKHKERTNKLDCEQTGTAAAGPR